LVIHPKKANAMEAISNLPTPEEMVHNVARRTIECPLPPGLGPCLLIQHFISASECRALIEAAEHRGFNSAELDYPPSYRNNDRQVLDDEQLAARLLFRLNEALPGGIQQLPSRLPAPDWKPESINERFRLCRYQPGQRFHIHQDGVHHRGPDCRSMLTFMVYLTNGDDFEGGDTLFFATGPQGGEGESNLVARIRPRAGSLILFDHGIWHAGEEVTRGIKYVLRSDLMFRRTQAADTPSLPHHQGYIWTLLELHDGRVGSGGRDGSIRIWRRDGVLSAILGGHEQSVLGLTEVRPGVIASVSRDRTLRYWDVARQRCIQTVIAHSAAVLCVVAISEQTVATGSADHTIRLWNKDGTQVRSLTGHTGWVWALANLGPDLLASVSEDGDTRIWDVHSGHCIAALKTPFPLRAIDVQRHSSTGNLFHLAVGAASGDVTLLSMSQGQLRQQASFKAHDAAVRRARFLHDGALATCGEDHRLRIWSAGHLQLMHEEIYDNFVTDVLELQDRTRVVCGYDGALHWK
jgi:predicted 2-oxoglutarate/Fe(II)-dependent dioxygenase YbiX